MKILREKQYAAFAANVKTLDSLRRNEVSYVPGVFEVAKVIILSKEDFEKLSEDVSPEYPFLKDNRELILYTSLLLVGVVQELPAQIPDWGMIFIYSKEVCH